MSTPVTKPIMLRARLTEEEWRDIRKDALDEKLHPADLVAELIRKGRECRAAEREGRS